MISTGSLGGHQVLAVRLDIRCFLLFIVEPVGYIRAVVLHSQEAMAEDRRSMAPLMTQERVAGDSIGEAIRLLRTLSDPTRLRLLGVLQHGEHNVSGLCCRLGLPQPTVSHHLGLLRAAALVANRRNGKNVYYSLNDETVEPLGAEGGLTISAGSLKLHICHQSLDGVEHLEGVLR